MPANNYIIHYNLINYSNNNNWVLDSWFTIIINNWYSNKYHGTHRQQISVVTSSFKNQRQNSFFIRTTVLADTSHSFAVLRTDVPLRSSRNTLPYSFSFTSLLFVLPTLRPSLPPSSTNLFLPDWRRKKIFSRSNSAHVPRTEIKMLRNGFLVPSLLNNERFSLQWFGKF